MNDKEKEIFLKKQLHAIECVKNSNYIHPLRKATARLLKGKFCGLFFNCINQNCKFKTVMIWNSIAQRTEFKQILKSMDHKQDCLVVESYNYISNMTPLQFEKSHINKTPLREVPEVEQAEGSDDILLNRLRDVNPQNPVLEVNHSATAFFSDLYHLQKHPMWKYVRSGDIIKGNYVLFDTVRAEDLLKCKEIFLSFHPETVIGCNVICLLTGDQEGEYKKQTLFVFQKSNFTVLSISCALNSFVFEVSCIANKRWKIEVVNCDANKNILSISFHLNYSNSP